MAVKTEFTPQETMDLIQAHDLSILRLPAEEQAILEQVEEEKESLRIKLNRDLTDEEEESVESTVPGAKDIINKVSDTMSTSLHEVRVKSKKEM